MNTNALSNRLPRVLSFDASVYREIAADPTALNQAAVVVIVAAILNAIGQGTRGLLAVLVVAVLNLIAFAIYVAVATVVSKGLFQGRTDFNEMARTLGYAYIWYALGILALIPFGGGLLAFIGWIAAVVAGVIALRESSEFDTTKAVVTVIIAAIVAALINFFVAGPILLLFGAASA
jgi:hypothetical protein